MTLMAKIEELFNNPEKASKEGIGSLVQEAVQFLKGMKERLESTDEAVRNEAFKEAQAMQSQLGKQIEKMQGSGRIHPTQLENSFEAAEAAIQAQKNELRESVFGAALEQLQGNMFDPSKKKKPKRVKEWLAS